jgi:putative transcriptional regulator
VWYPVACSRQLALKQVIQLPKPLWREVMELCGGELRQTSKRSYGEEET